MSEKTRENRLRRRARRRRLELTRIRRRDPLAWDKGLYLLTDRDGRPLGGQAADEFKITLAEVERILALPAADLETLTRGRR